jgi:hypothetical protein
MQVFFTIFIPESVLTDGWAGKMSLQRENGIKKAAANFGLSGVFNTSFR